MEKKMSDFLIYPHVSSGNSIYYTLFLVLHHKIIFRFRYESMESAFIDDLDEVYDNANSISLGYDSYFILNHDGSYRYHNIPKRLKVCMIFHYFKLMQNKYLFLGETQ